VDLPDWRKISGLSWASQKDALNGVELTDWNSHARAKTIATQRRQRQDTWRGRAAHILLVSSFVACVRQDWVD